MASVLTFAALTACGPVGDKLDGGTCPHDQPTSCIQPSPVYDGGTAAIIERRCLSCHNGLNSPSGLSLASYSDIQSFGAGTVLSQLVNCQMPPLDAGQLTEAERAEMLHWLVCGAPEH